MNMNMDTNSNGDVEEVQLRNYFKAFPACRACSDIIIALPLYHLFTTYSPILPLPLALAAYHKSKHHRKDTVLQG